MPVKKRVTLITIITFLGALLFIPFMAVNNSVQSSDMIKGATAFTSISTLIAAIASFFGFKFSDKEDVSMPILRNWEYGNPINKIEAKSVFIKAITVGVVVALVIITLNYFMGAPTNKGNFVVRILTAVWASVATETISHLFVLMGLVRLIKNKWFSLLLSGIVITVIFHLNTQYDLRMNIYLAVVNFLVMTVTGYMFIKKGFESAVATHLIIHIILLGVNI